MARIRTIKPEFWRNDLLSKISAEACLLAIGLLNHCDDEGYFNANPKLIQADIFPLRELSRETTVLLRELSEISYLQLFRGSDLKEYGCVVNFEKHQVINKKTPSKIKDLCELPYDYGSDTEALLSGKERKGKEHGKEIGKEVEKKQTNKVIKPDDVDQQIWDDWVQLRKSKKATVTQTVITEARNEALKANLSFEDFLKAWCLQGSQGFKAEWIKDKAQKQVKSFYQTDLELKQKRHDEMVGRNHREVIDITPNDFLELK
jgi:hypothetical protein